MLFDIAMPILGFDDLKKVKLTKIDELFMKLDNVESDKPSFTLINPFMLRDYDIELPDSAKQILQLDENANVLVLNIMIVNSQIENSTINFIAPLVFNVDKNLVGQVILDSNKYTNYGIMDSLSNFIKTDEIYE
ncbi:MAG: flagellar assembly protein FliW [Campylobacterales bacterium]|nr:flagellar assembly protein FliW [Campylobacterales bacterium]